MPEVLPITRLGNPLLRDKARRLNKAEILSADIQNLVANIRYSLEKKKYGVGLAAPQVGKSVSLSVIAIKPTPTRPDVVPFSVVIINPEIIETYGRRTQLWEGCLSTGAGKNTLYAKVPRYKKIKLRWLDEKAIPHEEILEGLAAHVAQHEVDHLNGVLFVDLVKDNSTYMLADEYRKRIVKRK